MDCWNLRRPISVVDTSSCESWVLTSDIFEPHFCFQWCIWLLCGAKSMHHSEPTKRPRCCSYMHAVCIHCSSIRGIVIENNFYRQLKCEFNIFTDTQTVTKLWKLSSGLDQLWTSKGWAPDASPFCQNSEEIKGQREIQPQIFRPHILCFSDTYLRVSDTYSRVLATYSVLFGHIFYVLWAQIITCLNFLTCSVRFSLAWALFRGKYTTYEHDTLNQPNPT